MEHYSKEFKDRLIKRMLPPNDESITVISREEGVSKPTLRAWRNSAQNGIYAPSSTSGSTPQYSSEDKFHIVVETAIMTETDLAEFCRKKGLYTTQVNAWKDACLSANGSVAQEATRLNRELKQQK